MERKKGFYEKYIKRPQDFTLALLALIILSPVMLIIAILVRIKLGSPVLFIQERPGLHEKIFKMYKFRTMTEAKAQNGAVLPDEARLTRLGAFLRSTSLDELPELYNVLVGDMGLVGPRPLLIRYLPYFTDSERRRHSVRPGITGWAQVQGRNTLPWGERFQLDLEYIENMGFWLDLQVLIKTFTTVLVRKNILYSDVSPQELGFSDLDVDRAKPQSS